MEGVKFTGEIAMMMHGLGDASVPLAATVDLVESVVRSQLVSLARAAAARADGEAVRPEHVAFLMRNDPQRLRRLLRHLRAKEQFAKVEQAAEAPPPTQSQPLIRRLLRELQPYDSDEDMDDDPDDAVAQRKLRAERTSRALDVKAYEAFFRARCANFGGGSMHSQNSQKLMRWLALEPHIEMTPQTKELFRYLAHETVAQIVDAALIVRRDSRSVADEPFVKLEGAEPSVMDADYIGPSTPLTVAHIREALRRFFTPRIGIDGRFYRNITGDCRNKFLAA